MEEPCQSSVLIYSFSFSLKCQPSPLAVISDYHFFRERAEVMVASLRTDGPEMNIFL